MNNFFRNLVERHSQPAGNIKPRLPGVFEPDRITSVDFSESEENQLITSEKKENSNRSQSSGTEKDKIEKIKKEPDFQKNTISNIETNSKQSKSKTGDKFHSINESGNSPKNEQSNFKEKPVSRVKHEFIIKTEKRESKPNSSIENKNTGLSKLQIKPEIKQVSGEPYVPNKRIEESNLSENSINKNKVLPEKQTAPSTIKEISNKNERNGNTGLKLPERFNQWMNEPVKQSRLKENKISSSPTIKVNIGRIEVRAIMDQGGTPVSRKPAFKPKLSLEDYLNQRNGGKR